MFASKIIDILKDKVPKLNEKTNSIGKTASVASEMSHDGNDSLNKSDSDAFLASANVEPRVQPPSLVQPIPDEPARQSMPRNVKINITTGNLSEGCSINVSNWCKDCKSHSVNSGYLNITNPIPQNQTVNSLSDFLDIFGWKIEKETEDSLHVEHASGVIIKTAKSIFSEYNPSLSKSAVVKIKGLSHNACSVSSGEGIAKQVPKSSVITNNLNNRGKL